MSAIELIDNVVELVAVVLRAPNGADLSRERTQAKILLVALRAQQEQFRAAHGPDAANPAVRAWYLLQMMTEHATLLREGVL